MATFLIILFKLDEKNPDNFFHLEDITATFSGYKGRCITDNYAELKHFGLIQPMPNDDPKKKSSGYWRITEKGRQFVRGEISVPEKALLFNSKCYGFLGEDKDIVACLGKHFDYEELMQTIQPEALQ